MALLPSEVHEKLKALPYERVEPIQTESSLVYTDVSSSVTDSCLACYRVMCRLSAMSV